MSSTRLPLDPLRILVVEDEFLLSVMLEEDLRDSGAAVIGPHNSLGPALAAGECETFDCAILDVNLGGTMVFPLADLLVGREVPFLFLSGYSAEQLPRRFQSVPRLAKPYDLGMLIRAITGLV